MAKHIGTLERHYDEKNGARYVEIDLPSDKQVGGDHYKNMAIQPSEFIFVNKLNWLQGNAIKYICRYGSKGGEQDLDKAIHYIELLKEWDCGKTETMESPDNQEDLREMPERRAYRL